MQLRDARPSLWNEYTPQDPSLFLASPRNVASPSVHGRVDPFKRISKQERSALWRLPQCVSDDGKARAVIASLNGEDLPRQVSSIRRRRAQSALQLRTLPSADFAIEDAVHQMTWRQDLVSRDLVPSFTEVKTSDTRRQDKSDLNGCAVHLCPNLATAADPPGATLVAKAQVALSQPATDQQAASLPVMRRAQPTPESTFRPESSHPHSPDARSPSGLRPRSSQPGSSQPGSSRPGSSRPGSSRPGSSRHADSRPASSRLGSSRPGSSRSQPWNIPESSEIDTRKPANEYEEMRELLRQNRWIRQKLARHGVVHATDNVNDDDSEKVGKPEAERKSKPIDPSSIANPSTLIEQQLRMLRASGPVADEPPWAFGGSLAMSAAAQRIFPPSLQRMGSSLSEIELPHEEPAVSIDTATNANNTASSTSEGKDEDAVDDPDMAASAAASGGAAVPEEDKPPDLCDQLPGLATSFSWVGPAPSVTKEHEGEDDSPPLGLLERAPSVSSVASSASQRQATPRSVGHFMEHLAAEDAAALNEAAIPLRAQMQLARAEANAKEAELRQLSDLYKGLLVNANARPHGIAAPSDVRCEVARLKELEHLLKESEEANAHAEDMHATLEHMLSRAKKENPERERDILLMRLNMVEADQIIETLRERHRFADDMCRNAKQEVKNMQLVLARQRTEHLERKSEMHARVRERERARAELALFGTDGHRQASSVGGLRRPTTQQDSKPGESGLAGAFSTQKRKLVSVEVLWERLCALTGVSSTRDLIQFWDDSLRAKATLTEAEHSRKVALEALQREAKYHSTYLASLQRIARGDDSTIAIDQHWKEVELEANLKERALHSAARRLSDIESLCEGAIAQLVGISAKLQKKWLLDKAPSILRHMVHKSQARLDALSEQIKELVAPRDQASLASAVRKAQFNAEAAASTAQKLQASKGDLGTDGAATAAMGEVAAAAASIAAGATTEGHAIADAAAPGVKSAENTAEKAGGGLAADASTAKSKESKSKVKNKPMDNAELAQEMIAETQAMWSAQLCTNVEKLMAVLFDIWRAPVIDKAIARPDHPVHLQSDVCVELNLRTRPPDENEWQLVMNGDEDTSAWDPASAFDLSSRRASFKPGASTHLVPDGKRGERSGEAQEQRDRTTYTSAEMLSRKDIKWRAHSQLQHVTSESGRKESDSGVTADFPGESRPTTESSPATTTRVASAEMPSAGVEGGAAAVTQPESHSESANPSKSRRRVTFDEPTDVEPKMRTARRKGPAQPFVFDDKD